MLSECNLCGGEIRERDTERCSWCLNPIENDADYIEDRYVDRSGVVREKYPRDVILGNVKFTVSLPKEGVWIWLSGGVRLTPIQAHQLARWILGNVPEPKRFP